MGDALLEIESLDVRFDTPRGEIHAVDGVSLRIDTGETLALVGESGSGKSVTALSVLRLFNRADRARVGGRMRWQRRGAGTIDLNELEPSALVDYRGAEVGVIFQDPGASLNPVFSIGAQLRETIARHRPTDNSRRVAIELLNDVGIADPERRLRSYPHQLSGGMRQRVMIAIALACAPRLLIADEPTTALDVTIQAQIVRLLRDLKQRHGMALLFITHDLGLVGEIADRVAVMYAGQVVETGPIRDVLEAPRHPYTRALLDCRPRRRYCDDGPDERLLQPIPGAPPRPGAVSTGCRFAPRCVAAIGECKLGPVAMTEFSKERSVRCVRWLALS